jgi:lysophospholipid acyltransferase (LPLAT)-like uncharacterized protein
MDTHLKDKLREQAPVPAARLLRALARLVRTRMVGQDQIRQLAQVNFAHWHGDELALLPRFGTLNAAILVSHSKDGEIMARGARYLGYHVVRGSSSRGAVGGMMALIKASREGHHASLAVDGPQGPRHVCKPGIVRLTQKAGVPLLPTGVAVSRTYVFQKAWNKTFLPLPFSRQVIFFGTPLTFGPEKDAQALEAGCRQVEAALHQAHERARQLLDQWR